MFSFGGRPAVINYIWRGPGSQNSVFGKLQGYWHQIHQFVVEIKCKGNRSQNYPSQNCPAPTKATLNWVIPVIPVSFIRIGYSISWGFVCCFLALCCWCFLAWCKEELFNTMNVCDSINRKRRFLWHDTVSYWPISSYSVRACGGVRKECFVFITLPVTLLQICHACVSHVGVLLNFH